MSDEEKYCYKILDIIKNKKDLLLLEKQKIINEYKKYKYIYQMIINKEFQYIIFY